jgi:leucyl/phenylalanyl-tRNA---protein transferase
VIPWLAHRDQPLPPSSQALGPRSEAPGLLAAGGEITRDRLVEAYSRGVFPWYSRGQPVLWWSPDPRMVLPVDQLRLTASLRKTLRRFARTPGCEVRIDNATRRVMEACARTRRQGQDGTWIMPEMIDTYCNWPAVHSFETWIDGELVGGLYGVGLGRMFYGESMFALRTDASKIALAALVAFCRANAIPVVDCQQRTEHLASLGAREIPRADFEAVVEVQVREAPIAQWSYDPAHWDRLAEDPPRRAPRPEDSGP